ncbi:MAG TPA: hypothetical protein PK829_12550, partial [Promineifilum sp.]|nr:hypothetical protein [Promineifilum sp.]
SCHNTEGHYYTFTGHAAEGLLCTDCHLRISDSPEAGTRGHGARSHTFQIDLESCNDCHLSDMHAEVDSAMAATTAVEGQAQTDVACYPVETTDIQADNFVPAREEVTPYVSQTPSGPGPLAYLLPAGIGLVFGTMVAPWVNRWTKRRHSDSDSEQGEK